MKTISVIISLFLFCLNLSAQDVEGVAIDSFMTKVQVVEKFGEPEEYTLKNPRKRTQSHEKNSISCNHIFSGIYDFWGIS